MRVLPQVEDQDQDQVQENLITPEGMQFSGTSLENQLHDEDNISLSTKEGIRSLVARLENRLCDNNNKVSFRDFERLAEELLKTSGLAPLPDELKPFAAQIKEARGEETGMNHMHNEVIVCAAIKEMKCLPSELVNWNMLKKWRATLNYAKQNGFHVNYADFLLEKNLKLYVLEELNDNNNKVSFKDFEGLAEALLKTSGLAPLPDELKPFAAQIKEAHGEETGINHLSIEVIICAAIKEIECLPSESVTWDMLKKWGATLNYAKQNGFQGSFADVSLKRNLKSFVLDKYYRLRN
ncbi:hemA [Gossypium australe]|uniref:HemA n=1 Tax=Gossypium australe TaxID=47621 RepID=A0A5B6VSD0_9ROSI|nr:hemA [Gossypium australe]